MLYDIWLGGQLLWNLPLLVCLICIGGLYVSLLVTFTNLKLYQKQPMLFFLSLVLMYVTLGSPLAALSHLSFSLHMLQMSILFFIIPPLFLLGIPELQSFSDNFILKQVGKLMIPPLAALYIFGALFLMYHLTVVLTFLSQHPFVHNGYLAVLLLLSFSMWRPIASPAPNAKGQIKRYVLISGLVLMPACLLFIITAIVGGVNNPLLTQMTAALCISPSQLSSFNILPSPFNTSYDQMMAGILMIGMHKLGLILTVRLRNIVQRGIRVEIVE